MSVHKAALIEVFTLENEFLKMEVLNYGAIIKSFLNGHGISQIHLPFLHFACIF